MQLRLKNGGQKKRKKKGKKNQCEEEVVGPKSRPYFVRQRRNKKIFFWTLVHCFNFKEMNNE